MSILLVSVHVMELACVRRIKKQGTFYACIDNRRIWNGNADIYV